MLAACSLAGSAAHAQQRDDAWVIAQVTSGKFEELRSLEKLSAEGVPLAMYWWGSLIHFCVFDRCDQREAWELTLRAAKAGHGRAQARVFAVAAEFGPGEIADKLTAGIGVPKDQYARQVRAIAAASTYIGMDPKVRADFVALATSERQVGLLAHLVTLEGLSKRDEVRALAESGYVVASDMARQVEIIRRTTDEQVIERARAGELWLAAAHCDTAGTERSQPILEPATLSVCERAAAQGFPGAVRALLRHHHHTKNHRAADYFADACNALLGFVCAKDIAAYYGDRRDESESLRAKWELWHLADGLLEPNPIRETHRTSGRPSDQDLRGRDAGLRRSLLTLVVRSALINEACLLQRLDVKTGAREANPQCPWRKPIAIPAEFLSGAK